MSAPTTNVKTWDTNDFMQFISSLKIKGSKYDQIKKEMEDNGLSVSDIKGTVQEFASLFAIPSIIAKKIRKALYDRRLKDGFSSKPVPNIPEGKENETGNGSINNNSQFAVNLRGNQGKMTTLRKLFTANSLVGDVVQAYKDEECGDLNYKVEKIILTSNRKILKHDKKLGDPEYNITNEHNLITVVFKTKGGAMPADDDERVIRFKKYGLKKSHLSDCLIGYDDEDGIDRALLDCGKHAMSAETMFAYVTTSLASNPRQRDIYCPIKGCNKKLSWAKCTQIADMNQKEYLKWTGILEDHRLSDLKRCPHCKAYCKRDDGVAIFRMRCIACKGSDWCWNCCQPWKGSGLSMCCNQNCSIIVETNDKLANCELVQPKDYKYKMPRFRACPRCLTFIEYTTACKHMICSGCDKRFCFVCLSLQASDGSWTCGGSGNVCEMAKRQQFK